MSIFTLFNLNYSYIFVFCILAALYVLYVSPWYRAINNFKNDTQLNGHLGIVALGKHFDPRSHNKALHHLRRFLFYYSESYTHSQNTDKLKYHQYNCMKYLRRIPFRLHNDENLKYGIEQAIDNINLILENYTFESHDRNEKFYFGQYT